MLKSFFKNNKIPLGIYILFLAIVLTFILSMNKTKLHLSINDYVGNAFIDKFFLYLTLLGDGVLGVLIIIIAFFINIRLGIYLTLSFLFAALITNLLKYQFFNEAPRPHFVFQWVEPFEIKKVEGVELMILKSFPSGHATQSFAIFFALALAVAKSSYKVLFASIAVLAAFSRVYLSQHWLQDITAGSVIGVFFAILFYFLFFERNTLIRLNKPLVKFKKS